MKRQLRSGVHNIYAVSILSAVLEYLDGKMLQRHHVELDVKFAKTIEVFPKMSVTSFHPCCTIATAAWSGLQKNTLRTGFCYPCDRPIDTMRSFSTFMRFLSTAWVPDALCSWQIFIYTAPKMLAKVTYRYWSDVLITVLKNMLLHPVDDDG